ncbi:MAG: tetratricopeptide repeat protein [Sporolactobacillus sp.]
MKEAAERAMRLIEQKKYDQAVHVLEEAIEQEPDNPEGYVNFGNLLITLGEAGRAPAFFEKALALSADRFDAVYGLGSVCFETGDYEQALTYFQQAQLRGMNTNDLFYMIGQTALKLHHNGQALASFQRAVELSPEDVSARFQYALALANFGQIDAAEPEFRRVIERQKDHADAYYNLGVIALYRERLEEAKRFFEQTLACDPQHVLAAHGCAVVRARQQQ